MPRTPIKPPRHALLAMAVDFVAFMLGQKELAEHIEKVIVFGSVARGDYEAQSDVDIFIESEPRLEKRFQKVLELWEASKRSQEWRILGVENALSLKIGRMADWPTIRRAAIADGIQLYGKYVEVPKGLKHYLLITIKTPKLSAPARVVLSRQLFGYSQKVGKKVYTSPGLVGKLGGQRIARGVLILPAGAAPRLFDFLRQHGIACTMREFWSD